MTLKSTTDSDWRRYFSATRGRPPRPTLLRALESFDREPHAGRIAIDLGCGGGRDTVELLERGWRVVAIDRAPSAVGELESVVAPWQQQRLHPRIVDFCASPLPAASLIVASFSLPFVTLPRFLDLWRRIFVSLRPGGRFAGQLLGPKDSWVRAGRCHGFDRRQLHDLCRGYRIERIGEEQTSSTTPFGEAKDWHLWHVNLQKP